jgi:predicted aldo/keto reductase-like oxidoreductase
LHQKLVERDAHQSKHRFCANIIMVNKVSKKTKSFNGIKENPSILGFGCMRLIDIKQAEEMIDYAYNQGVNYFDTAYPYHEGISKRFIGEALKKYPRDSFFLRQRCQDGN